MNPYNHLQGGNLTGEPTLPRISTPDLQEESSSQEPRGRSELLSMPMPPDTSYKGSLNHSNGTLARESYQLHDLSPERSSMFYNDDEDDTYSYEEEEDNDVQPIIGSGTGISHPPTRYPGITTGKAPYPEDDDDVANTIRSNSTRAFSSMPIGGIQGFADEDLAPVLNPFAEEAPGMVDPYRSASPANTDYTSATGSTEAWQNRQQVNLGRFPTRKIRKEKSAYVVDYPVPSAVKNAVLPEYKDTEKDPEEFTKLRYTAACCDPDDFNASKGYKLRNVERGRSTELLIAITYYNEDKVLTARTLYGVMQNIRDICNLKKSHFWSKGKAWEQIVVTLIMDGIDPCDKNVLDMLATIGVYQDGIMRKSVDGEETVAHIFEYTTQLCVTGSQKLMRPLSGDKSSLPPIQFILLIKQRNAKKINSHRWLFNGLARQLNPEVCVLLDAGTKPGNKAILALWQAFYNNKNIGGACGEIHAMLGKNKRLLLNPLVATQNFEYKVSNLLDKPLESGFGFISVLPGAFSAYRYRAIVGKPLEQYFHGDHSLSGKLGNKGIDNMNIFTKNMFLAEDRILCFEVTFKAKQKWHLTYVKASRAETDVPEGLAEFIVQRRRWTNGSFAASLYGMMHFYKIYRSGHNILRMFFFHIQLLYNFLTVVLQWFSLATYYLTTTIIMELSADPNAYGAGGSENSFPGPKKVSVAIALILKYVYTFCLILSFLLALGNRPKGSRLGYNFIVFCFGVIQYYVCVLSLYLAAQAFIKAPQESATQFFKTFFTSVQGLIIVALFSNYGIHIISGLLYLDPWHVLTSFLQYNFFMPSFANVVNVYAFCNWHDVSWGTKGADKADALPEASTVKKDGQDVIEEIDLPQEVVDERFQEVVKRALTPYVPPKEKEERSVEDESRTFRTGLIVSWIFANMILVLAITSTSITDLGVDIAENSRTSTFFAILLWATALLSLVRLVGHVIFIIKTWIGVAVHKK